MSKRSEDFEQLAFDRVNELGTINTDAFTASFELFRLCTRYLSHLEAEIHRPIGLSVAGFRVLFTVWLHDEMEPRTLADLSGVSRAAVSGVLNTLERDGHIQRTRESADRRLVTVRITSAGRQLLERAYQDQNEFEKEFFAELDERDLATFVQLLRRLLHSPTWHANHSKPSKSEDTDR